MRDSSKESVGKETYEPDASYLLVVAQTDTYFAHHDEMKKLDVDHNIVKSEKLCRDTRSLLRDTQSVLSVSWYHGYKQVDYCETVRDGCAPYAS